MQEPSSSGTAVRLPLTPNLECRLEAWPGRSLADVGYYSITHWRRSLNGDDTFHPTGGGVRLRRDRVTQLIEALLDLEQRAMSAGVWAPRAGHHG